MPPSALKNHTFHEAKMLYKGTRFDFLETQIRTKSGKKYSRELISHPGAVLILPLLDEETIIFIKNERFAVGQELWELPAGTIEPKEDPATTAKRELLEEAGYHAKNLEPMLNFYMTPGYCTERMFCYIARNLKFVGQDLDETEHITQHKIPIKEAINMVRNGLIIDAKTIAALLYFNLN